MTGTALALNHDTIPAAAGALAIQAGQPEWDATQLAALAQIGLADASAGDRAVFLHVCQRTGLDPFARQIYMIGRNEKYSERVNGQWVEKWRKKWTIQTGIDGFRVNRDRAERKAGVRGILGRAIFYGPDGDEHKVWVSPRPPVACEITYTVRDRDGSETPYTSVLRFTEYVQTKEINGQQQPIAQWATKPAHMLEKVTEADVYRKAFPQDFSGMYLEDAMPQGDQPADGPENGNGRPRGRVTAGEIIGNEPEDGPKTPAARTARRETAAAGDGTRSRRQARTQASRPGADERDANPAPAAAGDAPPREPQHLPPLPEDSGPAPSGQPAGHEPAAGPGQHAAALESGEAAEYGTERHRKMVGVVWQHLGRLGYPAEKNETDQDRAARLADVARLAGVSEIGSTSDLDLGELTQAVNALARCKDRDAVRALLESGEISG